MFAAQAEERTEPLDVVVLTLESFWWLWVLLVTLGAAKLGWRFYRARLIARSGIADIDRMDGVAFEKFLTALFRRLGYAVEHTGRRGDYGADLIVAKDGRRTVVQAKRWTRNVGIKAVQEAVAAKAPYRCADALVVTNRYFSGAASKLARANGVLLWDRDTLVEKLLSVRH